MSGKLEFIPEVLQQTGPVTQRAPGGSSWQAGLAKGILPLRLSCLSSLHFNALQHIVGLFGFRWQSSQMFPRRRGEKKSHPHPTRAFLGNIHRPGLVSRLDLELRTRPDESAGARPRVLRTLPDVVPQGKIPWALRTTSPLPQMSSASSFSLPPPATGLDSGTFD